MFHIRGFFRKDKRVNRNGIWLCFFPPCFLSVPRCSCPGMKPPFRVHRGRPLQVKVLIPWWCHLRKCQHPVNLAGFCNRVIDPGKDHNLHSITLSDRERISHLSKNGRNRHKGALVFTGSPASKACRLTRRTGLKISLKGAPLVTQSV